MWGYYIKRIPFINFAFFALAGLLVTVNSRALYNFKKSNTSTALSTFQLPACGTVTNLSACSSSMQLNAEPNQPNYSWSTGATTPSITVTASGSYWWETTDLTNNKVTNGDFTNDNTGFTSDYIYQAPGTSTGGAGALTAEGRYSVVASPKTVHNNFADFPDHTANTTGARNMMVVNGAPTAGKTIWRQSITVQPNTDYIFSVWFTSANSANPGQLSFSINNTSLGNPILLTAGLPDWKNFTVRWSSGNNTSAVIGIVNQNTIAYGNDFALDDITFSPVCRNTFNVNLYSNPPKPSISL
ncbi:hypothetical protein ABDD95_23210 [Mucilaginibacter sp. PAMB04274]|uniref:hypothetical protein n=1 Tax=Mucilaginibacter sp. PAMB04274 TaxID=3138568 RepID=UPI0031F6CE57